jgi:hypothetical protein
MEKAWYKTGVSLVGLAAQEVSNGAVYVGDVCSHFGLEHKSVIDWHADRVRRLS